MSYENKLLTDHQADKLAHVVDEEIKSLIGPGAKSMTFVFNYDKCSIVTNCAKDEIYLRFCIINMQEIYKDLYGK